MIGCIRGLVDPGHGSLQVERLRAAGRSSPPRRCRSGTTHPILSCYRPTRRYAERNVAANSPAGSGMLMAWTLPRLRAAGAGLPAERRVRPRRSAPPRSQISRRTKSGPEPANHLRPDPPSRGQQRRRPRGLARTRPRAPPRPRPPPGTLQDQHRTPAPNQEPSTSFMAHPATPRTTPPAHIAIVTTDLQDRRRQPAKRAGAADVRPAKRHRNVHCVRW